MKRDGKVISRSTLQQIRQDLGRQGRTVVFTNGCFDVLHRGHVEYLRQARQLGDVLIVGLNSDSSVRGLKGEGRPFMPEEDRAVLLAELRCVSYVCIFDELSVEGLVAELAPDVLAKGGDYRTEEIVGHQIVQQAGGIVASLILRAESSTTTLIQKIKDVED